MLKLAKRICDLQGIKCKINVTVICPHCEAKTLIIDSGGSGHCRCGYNAEIYEILEQVECKWEDDHRKTINLMTKRGD